jgi:hypothetical protein
VSEPVTRHHMWLAAEKWEQNKQIVNCRKEFFFNQFLWHQTNFFPQRIFFLSWSTFDDH